MRNILADLDIEPNSLVHMDSAKYIEGHGKLGTYGLNGCWSTVLYTNNGTRRGILAHYAPNKLKEHKEALLAKINPSMRLACTKKALILVPSDLPKEWYEPDVTFLESAMRTELDAVEIQRLFYQRAPDASRRQVVLSLDDSSWSTWFADGRFE